MFKSLLLALAVASCVAGTAAADVYKYKDEKGNIQYTDKPPSFPAERMGVQSQRTDEAAVQARVAAEQKQQAAATAARQKSDTNSSDQKQAAELNAKDKAERCIQARERYQKYMNSQRLFEKSEDGERRYLTDQELDSARNNAKSSMDTLCQ